MSTQSLFDDALSVLWACPEFCAIERAAQGHIQMRFKGICFDRMEDARSYAQAWLKTSGHDLLDRSQLRTCFLSPRGALLHLVPSGGAQPLTGRLRYLRTGQVWVVTVGATQRAFPCVLQALDAARSIAMPGLSPASEWPPSAHT